MLSSFALGLILFAFNRPKPSFVSFACTAALCIFLKDASHQEIKHALQTNKPSISIAHFNLANSESDYDIMLEAVLKTNADLLSFQELTLDWEDVLTNELTKQYPYQVLIPDLGLNGLAVYSKYPIEDYYIFDYEDSPNIVGKILLSSNDYIYFIDAHTLPALDQNSFAKMKAHLKRVEQECQMIDAPLIVFGDYHSVSWSQEIRAFKANTLLNDSRKAFTPSFPKGNVDFLEVPIDHIFYSNHFKCTQFTALNGATTPHLGIVGRYELISNDKRPIYNATSLFFSNVPQ
jgi:endonuclease/exonuclease/phosphatase (EEP) superfamily protein YafD